MNNSYRIHTKTFLIIGYDESKTRFYSVTVMGVVEQENDRGSDLAFRNHIWCKV